MEAGSAVSALLDTSMVSSALSPVSGGRLSSRLCRQINVCRVRKRLSDAGSVLIEFVLMASDVSAGKWRPNDSGTTSTAMPSRSRLPVCLAIRTRSRTSCRTDTLQVS